jgi:hypothetical protein
MADRYRLTTPRLGKDGKTYWTNVGVMFPMKGKDGFSIILEALPLQAINDQGTLECRMMAFDATEDQQSGRAKGNRYPQQPLDKPVNDLDDDMPF